MRILLAAIAIGVGIPALGQDGSWSAIERACSGEVGDKAAIEACTRIIGSRNYNRQGISDAYYNRALSHGRLGDINNALRDYTQALNIHPTPESYRNRGNIYARRKQWDSAIADFKNAQRLDPKNADMYFSLGKVYLALGQRHMFHQTFAAGFVYAQSPENLAIRAEVFLEEGKVTDALNDLNAAVKEDPSFCWLRLIRGDIHLRLKDKKAGVEDYSAGRDCQDDEGRAVFLARLAELDGRHGEARKLYEDALKADLGSELHDRVRQYIAKLPR